MGGVSKNLQLALNCYELALKAKPSNAAYLSRIQAIKTEMQRMAQKNKRAQQH